ncbi:acid phosphatase 1-like [Senna tora]|uniref:Acid phosphatase 1-like n=1 Tax=Senna tora TaxID=362788 RepID=A0A834XH69_9FABA|nr:acid phosphatase 1-like [Senna tora]
MMVQQAVLGLASFLGLTSKLKKLLYLQQKPQTSQYIWDDDHDRDGDEGYWLSWRVAVEANNVGPWRTVPEQCYGHVARYMMGGQYEKDVEMIRDEILKYASEIKVGDGKDGWVMDVDDTCISNVLYYGENGRFGCAPFNSAKFKEWIRKGQCPAIQGMLEVFRTLLERGFKVFLVTGRDETTMGHVTTLNLHQQGFIGYHRLFLREIEGWFRLDMEGRLSHEDREVDGGRWWETEVIVKLLF